MVAIVLLAATTAAATLVATNYRRDATQLRSHPPAATLPAVPSSVQLSTSAAATAGTSSAPAAGSPTQSAPLQSAPPLTLQAVDLDMAHPHATVYLAAAAAADGGFTDGQLVVTALIRGGQPGARYRLAGGDCELNEPDKVWAEGVADATGTAFLTGPDWTLPKVDQYYMLLETRRPGATASVFGPGLEGVFLLRGLLSPIYPAHSPCL